MTDRPDKGPPSLWVAVGPAFSALAMVFNLLNPKRTGPAWVSVLLLVGGLALIAFVLIQRRRATARNR
jgi:hypothetical protein